MKKFILIIGLLFTIFQAFAQQNPQAKKVLDKMSDQYQSFDAFEVKLLKSQYFREPEKKLGVQEAELLVKGNKYQLEAYGNKLLFDGQTLVRIDTVSKEAFYESASNDLMTNPTKILTFHKDGAKYDYKGTANIKGKKHHVVTLFPERKDVSFHTVIMYIDANTHLLSQWETLNSDNKTMDRYEIITFKKNVPATDNKFSFDQKQYEAKGYFVDDLR
ncbi:outer membrane lipoprotein carrier protein LolA [Algivirga pacifica]|uniref:Outer membrane lipoprotein carrier protein LolA n=1 Tax=Algivirga pacifica TaxID=1162670 RepID=A0ABP9D8L7_9BACT